jgi:hypothetical protein
MARTSLCVVFAFIVGASTVRISAADATIRLAPGEGPVEIAGEIGNDTSFTRRIGLVATAEVSATAYVSDLSGPGSARIPNSQVVLTPSGKFQVGVDVPTYLDIKISGVKGFGEYKGSLTILPVGQPASTGVPIPLTVVAHSVPALAFRKSGDTVKIQRVDCQGFGCRLAAWLEPSISNDTYPLQFDNQTPEPFEMIGVSAAFGELNHGTTTSLVSLERPVKVAVEPIVEIKASLSHTLPAPDRYVGDIQFKLPRKDAPLKIPLEVDVRSGPLMPIVVLLVGILLGRIANYMKQHGTAQSDLLLEVYRMEYRISQSPDRAIVQPMLDKVREEIYRFDLDAAKTELAAIEKRLGMLDTLRGFEAALTPRRNDPAVAAILGQIGDARVRIQAADDQKASELMTQIRAAIAALPPADAKPEAPRSAFESARVPRAPIVVAVPAAPKEPSRFVKGLVWMLSWISGIAPSVRAELALWLWRPALYVFLVAGVLAIGIQQLYLKNVAFGASPFNDYFGLLVWAFSGDTAGRTLSTLK